MRIYMSFAQELPILTGTVTANALDAALTLAYTVSTGDYTDVLPDQEVEIRRAGVFVGRLRVRGSGTTSTVLPVGEFSKGMVTVLAGDTLAVLNAWRIRYRLPSADEDFAPDHQTYVDQHKEPAPLACSGRNVVGFAVDLSAVQHDGSLSRNVAFGSTPSNVGHSWDMPDGNTSSSASPVFDYSDLNAGTHWGSHTVEDLTTGKTTTQRKVVRVHDDSDLPYEVLDAQLNGTPDGGSTLEVTLPDTVDIEDVADGALGWLWIEGGGILYEGYLLGDSIQKDAETETISFRMTSARGILELLPGFSTVLETVFTPTNWLEAFATTVNAAIVYRLRELTTVEVTCDIEIETGLDYPYPLYYLQESVPYAQVLELADAKDCLFTCTRTNLLRVVKPTWLMTDVERAAADTQQAFDADNVFTLDETREHRYPYSQVEGSGFAGDAPLFSRAPGNAPSEGPQKTTAERMITVSQSELNQRAGRRYGRLNALLFGKPIRKSSLNVLPTLYGLDPAYVDQFVTLDGITTKRGLPHDTTRMSLESLSESYSADTNGGMPEIDVDLQEETDGVPGVTYVPPSNETGVIDVGEYIDYEDYTPEYDPMPPYYGENEVPTKGIVFDAGGAHCSVFDAFNPLSSSLSYTDVSSGLGSGYNIWATGDAYDWNRYYALQSDGLYKNDDPFGLASWSLVKDNAALFGDAGRMGHHIITSINRQGYFAILSGTMYVYTTDYWATVQRVNFTGGGDNYATGLGGSSHMAISHFNNPGGQGTVYAAVQVGYPPTPTARVYRSRDWGATWTYLGDTAIAGNYVNLNVPYKKAGGAADNVDDGNQLVYLMAGPWGLPGTLAASESSGGSWTTKYTAGGAGADNLPPAGSYCGWGLQTFTYDADIVIHIRSAGGATNLSAMRFSEDKGATTTADQVLYHTGAVVGAAFVNGYPVHSGAALKWARAGLKTIKWTLDSGATEGGADTPATFSGSRNASYIEWNIADLV